MKCQVCQAEADPNSVYCPKCGERLDVELEPANEAAAVGPAEAETNQPEGEISVEPNADEQLIRAASSADRTDRDDQGDDRPLAWTQGGYSALALRGTFILICLATAVFVAGGIWLQTKGWLDGWTGIAWGLILLTPVVLWIRLGYTYAYRVFTIKYRLTAHQFYHNEGIFRRVRDVIEVIDIDDLKLEQTLWDRMINGGVGTVTVRSADQSTPEFTLHGLAKPKDVFESLTEARSRVRIARGFKAL